MKLDEIKEIAQQRGIKTTKMKKTEIIRTIQSTEQNEVCFETRKADSCGQEACLWRALCY